jgi:hypothetical protein
MKDKKLIATAIILNSLIVVSALCLLPWAFIEQPQQGANIQISLHLWSRQYRQGFLISESYHAMSLTTFGKNWICDNLAKVGGTNVTMFATYISLSNDSTSFSAAWTIIPNEITASGLGRANATFTDTGTGTWNMTKTFTASGTVSCKLYGLNINSYATFPNSLIAAEQQGIGSQKNLLSGDTLAVTIMGAIS